ncbi:MAG: aminotransferase class V-fold PLP-dependent enzyme, partial [Clostridia bacterium]|nr:aminotransferase class V-fold PLP-dependent enzyme [Clostridia bacterium]
LDLGWLEEQLKNCAMPVIFAGFMLVNNETGAVYNVKAASALVKKYYPDALVHCDAVQGYMKMKFTPQSLGADTVTVSAHKIHSIRGAAALYVSENVLKRRHLVPVMPGGGQESGFRSGTENLCAIASFAAAAEEARASLTENREKTSALRAKLDEGLSSLDIRFNRDIASPEAEFIDNICSVVLPGIKSETMLNFLSGKGVYVSAGSACSAYSKKKSAALESFGVTAEDADCTLRISLDHTNTEEDIDAVIAGLSEGIASLQRKK